MSVIEKNMDEPCLCPNCRNISKCTLRKDRTKQKSYSEEFKIGINPSIQATGGKKISQAASGVPDVLNEFIGICGNCNNRKVCSYSKPEGGIWHCEEYS